MRLCPTRIVDPGVGDHPGWFGAALAGLFILAAPSRAAFAADADTLVGIHQWGLADGKLDYTQTIDPTPATMLDSRARGAWDVEVVNTHGDPWQQAGFFVPLYRDLYTNKNVSIITRVEYKYGQTVPAPATIAPATWAGNVAGVVGTMKDWSHLWQLGNEPNLIESGAGWANNQITPRAYADAYKLISGRIHQADQVGAAGAPKVLVAPVSPGGVINGVRWKDGNQYLARPSTPSARWAPPSTDSRSTPTAAARPRPTRCATSTRASPSRWR